MRTGGCGHASAIAITHMRAQGARDYRDRTCPGRQRQLRSELEGDLGLKKQIGIPGIPLDRRDLARACATHAVDIHAYVCTVSIWGVGLRVYG